MAILMPRSSILRLMVIWLLLQNISARKNVMIIFGDDAGLLQTAYNNTKCRTPHLDELAKRSVVFSRGYTSVSSCSPSRSVLLSGLPQHQNGQYGLEHSVHHFRSFDGVRSLPVILSANNVRTGIVGKYHVGPPEVYKFEYDRSSAHYPINQVGRNITAMKQYVREFLQTKDDRPFFLYVAFFDPHRGPSGKWGPFMNKWGDGSPGMGVIPDWKPDRYSPHDVQVPYYLPDTPNTRGDLAAMYTTYGRMDQGIGLFMKELEASGHLDDTLVLFTSDNGIPFPNAKTNLYEPGMGEPMMISSPAHKETWGTMTDAIASTMDFVPTVLDWLGVHFPSYKLNGRKVELTGRSLLPVLAKPQSVANYSWTFSSHDLHEVTMFYPMRVVRTSQYRLIHNINHGSPYPLATDIFSSPTFLDILNRTRHGEPTHWFKTLQKYYYRDQFELFDLSADPHELNNLASDPLYKPVRGKLRAMLQSWLEATNDPWRCMPSGVLLGDQCHDMMNGQEV